MGVGSLLDGLKHCGGCARSRAAEPFAGSRPPPSQRQLLQS